MKKTFLSTTALVTISVFVMVAPKTVLANPEGGQVVGGSAIITEVGKKLNIHQHSDRAVIDWRSFDIEADEHTQFHQPTSSATALNRVNSMDPSRIAGKLSANGNIILVNPNGVFFEGTSRIDVNGVVATTANINPQDFMNGSNHFNITGNSDASIVNEGIITAKEAGLVGLVAPNVINNGIIMVEMGIAQLSSGDTVTVDFYGDGLLKVEVQDEDIKSQLVANQGIISANGGKVAMTTSAARETIDSLIVAGGFIGAQTISKSNGKIIIGGAGAHKTEQSGASYVAVTGILDASGREEGEQGGVIEVLGDHIVIAQSALVDASGHSAVDSLRLEKTGSATLTETKDVRTEEDFLAQDSRAGGSIKIGGDYLGTGETQTAKTLNVEEGAILLNDAVDSGDGGRTIIWSDNTTEYAALTISRGGENGGHGGFLETSGKENLKATGFADLTNRAEGYDKGTYLLDPSDITIYGNVDPSFVSTDSSIDLGSDLKIWLDADDSSTILDNDGDSVSSGSFNGGVGTWLDKSGNNYHVTSNGTNPTTGANNINGKNVITNTSGGRLLVTGLNDFISTETTIMSVLRSSNISGNAIVSYASTKSDNDFLLFHRAIYIGGSSTNTLGSGYGNGSPHILTVDWRNSDGLLNVHLDGALSNNTNNRSGYTLGTVNSALSIFGEQDSVGGGFSNAQDYEGDMGELLIYNTSLSAPSRHLVDQYKSAKWDLALTPPGSGIGEAAKAMASTAKGDATDGYGVFTVDYLERLSGSADIVLQADNMITLDLKGDTLTLDNNRNISLITTSSDITTASAGDIQTSGTGGISFNAGQDIILSHDLDLTTVGSGNINLTAARDITIGADAHLNANTGALNLTASRDVTLNSNIVTSSANADAIQINAGDDFINNAGNNALQAANSNWIVYSDSPVDNKNNGLLPDESFYNQANIAATITSKTLAGNNVFGYNTSTRPTLTYNVNNASVEYGDALGTVTTSYFSGLVGDDSVSTIGQTGTVTLANTYSAGNNAGSYVGSLTATAGTRADVLGYQYAFNAGDLTVTKADLTVVADNKTREYGDLNPALTASYTGFKLSEDESVIDTLATLNTGVLQTTDAGTAGAITVSGGSDNNYNLIGFTNGALSITKADLNANISPLNAIRNQGTANPDFSFNYIGFKLGETSAVLDTPPIITTTATFSSNAGIFPVTGSGGVDNNYNFIFGDTSLQIENRASIPSTVEQDFSANINSNIVQNTNFSSLFQNPSLQKSQIEVGIEDVDKSNKTTTPSGPQYSKIQLKIKKSLADDFDVAVQDGVL